MAIVRRRKKAWYTKDLDRDFEVVAIRLNNDDLFEFSLPEHYREVFNSTSKDISQKCTINSNGVVSFNTLGVFDDVFAIVNKHFEEKVTELTREKVLVVSIQGRTELSSIENVFRINWVNDSDTNTYIDFKFERGIKVGNTVFEVYGGAISEWDKKSTEINVQRDLALGSKQTVIVIPFTEEREQFLISFQKELSTMIKRVDSFMDIFDNPSTLDMIDNGSNAGLLTSPIKEVS